ATGRPAAAASTTRETRLERLRLIDVHDRDIVFHRVHELARMTHQRLTRRLALLQRALALGAHQDFEQVGSQTHDAPLGAGGNPSRASAPGDFRHFGVTRTRRSRYTRAPSNVSMPCRAAVPMPLMPAPPVPMTSRFCESRSTCRVIRIYTGSVPSRNSSTSTATAYGTSS